jgi:hypothetical protein
MWNVFVSLCGCCLYVCLVFLLTLEGKARVGVMGFDVTAPERWGVGGGLWLLGF